MGLRRVPRRRAVAPTSCNLELEGRTLEDAADRSVRGFEDARTERVDGDARLERSRMCSLSSGSRRSPSSTRRSIISATGNVERRPGLHAGPHKFVEIERRGEEAGWDAPDLGGHAHRPSLDEVGTDSATRGTRVCSCHAPSYESRRSCRARQLVVATFEIGVATDRASRTRDSVRRDPRDWSPLMRPPSGPRARREELRNPLPWGHRCG